MKNRRNSNCIRGCVFPPARTVAYRYITVQYATFTSLTSQQTFSFTATSEARQLSA